MNTGFSEASAPLEPVAPLASGLPTWKLEDAKARFSEVVRLARSQGPQRVTVRGQDAVVVLSAADDTGGQVAFEVIEKRPGRAQLIQSEGCARAMFAARPLLSGERHADTRSPRASAMNASTSTTA